MKSIEKEKENLLILDFNSKIMKCDICNEEIEKVFLGKLNGTIVKILEGEKNVEYRVCDKCQKEYKDKIKDKIKEMNE